ncbi:DUF3331 domain-containing protein [Caballeronia sp. AZ7_KS35]|uniref:DUF3331 domain-containing protein n=1 Tax=Caballeronia sp. AZ7_KS35 TaxID=2921762 RepID=UPI00202863C6|nr:DUF3331 domain-containing protein [Caballeronia sp. AZ7_KS35]
MNVDHHDSSSVAWQSAVDQLDARCAHQLAAQVWEFMSSQTTSRVANRQGAVSLALLERISPRTVTVSWSDPQGCKYGEQLWRVASAKRAGLCVLTGQLIAKGEAIYRPCKTARPPMNANAMMLATALEIRLPSEETASGSAR